MTPYSQFTSMILESFEHIIDEYEVRVIEGKFIKKMA